MHPVTKIFLVVAAMLVVLGAALFVAVMQLNHWDFSRLRTEQYVENTYTVTENYTNILVLADTADICFVPAEDGKCSIVSYESEYNPLFAGVQNDILLIDSQDTRKWYEHIGICFDRPKFTVYLPLDACAHLYILHSSGDITVPAGFSFESAGILLKTGNVQFSAALSKTLDITTTTGNIQVMNTSAGNIVLSTTTGDITVSQVTCQRNASFSVTAGNTVLTDMTCQNLTSNGSTGDIRLQNVIAAEKCTIRRSTGKLSLDGTDAGELQLETGTGDITGSLYSDKVFLPRTSTGNVQVPDTTTGGKCQIQTTTGDIHISISEN